MFTLEMTCPFSPCIFEYTKAQSAVCWKNIYKMYIYYISLSPSEVPIDLRIHHSQAVFTRN